MNHYKWILFVVALSTYELSAQSLQLSGGFDTRYRKTNGEPNTFELHGAFLNMRKVFSDELGDRLILVTQYDFEDNFQESHFYYTYAQLKGPLGKINLRIGRYVLPFGLLKYYDTERLLLQTMEKQTIDIKTDVGAQVFGYLDDLDYAFSVTNGVGLYWKDVDENKLIIARIGLNFDDNRFGLSYLNGRIFAPATSEFPVEEYSYKRLIAFDLQQYVDLFTIRGELTYGRVDAENTGGGFAGIDYALLPNLDANFKYALWNTGRNEHFIGAGLSYNILTGAYFRFADTFQIKNNKVINNEIQLQIYIEFLNQL